MSKKLILPDKSMIEYFHHHTLNDAKVVVLPHPDLTPKRPALRPQPGEDKTKLAVIGTIGPHKGSRILYALGAHIEAEGIPLELHVIGDCDIDLSRFSDAIVQHGRYNGEAHVFEILDEIAPDGAFLPSVCPESYCYALSTLMRSGIPIGAFGIGAQKTRLEAYSRGSLIPFETRNDIPKLAKWLLHHAWRSAGRQPLERPNTEPPKSLSDYLGITFRT